MGDEPALPHTFLEDPLGALARLHARPEPVVRVRLGRQDLLYLREPEAIAELLTRRHRAFVKATVVNLGAHGPLEEEARGPLLGSDDHARHVAARRLLHDAFRRERVASYAPVVERETEELLERAGAGPLELTGVFGALTAAITAQALFEAAGIPAAELAADIDAVLVPYALFADPERPPPQDQVEAAGAAAQRAIATMTRALAAADGKGSGILDLLLRAAGELGVGDGREPALALEALGVFAAGSETTAQALAWALGRLAVDESLQERLRAESRAVAGGGELHPHLAQLRLARAVFAETLRLYPPSWFVARRAVAATSLAGEPVEPPAVVVASPYLMQRDPRYWEGPERFLPERWLEGDPARPRLAFFPFGGGARRCLGEQIAWLEGTLVPPLALRRFRLAPRGALPERRPAASLRPAGPLGVELVPYSA